MYQTGDTICAVSSATAYEGPCESIIRISGPMAFAAAEAVFSAEGPLRRPGVSTGMIKVDGLALDASLYSFAAPRSYTGEDLAELHFFAAWCVVERVMAELTSLTRPAGPGEFTLRAYLNGRIDMTQAEAVAQIVAGSNSVQLAAAGRLLEGRLGSTIGVIRRRILDLLSLLEAGMDFSGEDISFITSERAAALAREIRTALDQVIEGSVRYENLIDLPSVGLAGTPNAGKSSLLNALLGRQRSIVSQTCATTRDVLTGVLQLPDCRCVVFDCAGLGEPQSSAGLLDELGRQAAAEALKSADIVLFCVDMAKADLDEDLAVGKMIGHKRAVVVGTKADLVVESDAALRLATFADSRPSVLTSTRTGQGLNALAACIESALIDITAGSGGTADRIAINQRHEKIVSAAIEYLEEASAELSAGNEEVAAMLLRSAYERLGGIEKEDVDEAILERIFSNFCIGK